jgi:hypothetical protein
MNRPSFVRKMVYLGLVAVLLVPLAQLSQPATVATPGRPASAGGVLARERREFKLGQANLGKIDPASETIRLATFGLGPLASAILWTKAEEYKEQKDWTRLSAAYQQIAYLNPNYVEVWRHQAWNLSYNISAELDDYRDRYYWVIRGLEFLEEGLEYNENEPRLLQAVGWFAAQKIGRSDERRQYRRLFRDDDEFHKHQRVHERDNFLFAREYYREAERVIENPSDVRVLQVSLSPVVFFMHSSMAQMSYAQALDSDYSLALALAVDRSWHVPGAKAAETQQRLSAIDRDFAARITAAWAEAERMWDAYGQRRFLTADGTPYRFTDLAERKAEFEKTVLELEALAPDIRQELRDEKYAALPEEQRRAYDLNAHERSEEQERLASLASLKLTVTYDEIGDRAAKKHPEARDLGRKAMQLELLVDKITSERTNANYDYWSARAKLEQSAKAREARRLVHRGSVAFEEADLERARRHFEEGFKIWADVLKDYPDVHGDASGAFIESAIRQYEVTLKQLDEPFPRDFPLEAIRQQV